MSGHEPLQRRRRPGVDGALSEAVDGSACARSLRKSSRSPCSTRARRGGEQRLESASAGGRHPLGPASRRTTVSGRGRPAAYRREKPNPPRRSTTREDDDDDRDGADCHGKDHSSLLAILRSSATDLGDLRFLTYPESGEFIAARTQPARFCKGARNGLRHARRAGGGARQSSAQASQRGRGTHPASGLGWGAGRSAAAQPPLRGRVQEACSTCR